MTWLNPAALAFLGFIPVVLLLHTLRHRRRDVQVSTFFLWESVLREAHGSLGWQRLVQNLPLLFQILLIIVLTAALANPVLTRAVTDNKDIILVLDVSASMQTRTSQGSRFTQAQQRALEVLQNLPSGRQMALITAGRQPQVVEFFNADKDVLREAIMRQQPTDASGNMREALILALSFTQGSGTHEVVAIGDGAYGPLHGMDAQRSPIRHMQVTGGEKNVGITRMALRKVQDAAETYDMLLAVKNFSSQPVQVPLQVTAVLRKPLLERSVALQPGQEEVIVATLPGPLKGTVQAEVLIDDDFPLDNRAYGVVATPTQTWVLLVGESNYFLETLLTSLPGLLVNVAPQVSEDTLPRLLEANQLIIFNGVQPPPLRRGHFLLLNTAPQDQRLVTEGTVQRPQVLDWQRQHPLLQFVDLTALHVEEALVVRPETGAQSLVDATWTSLLSVIDEPPLRVVMLAFDLMRSDLPLRVAFPVLMSNLLRWLHPPQEEMSAGHVQAGMPHTIFFDKPVSHITVQDPQGKQRDYSVTGNPWTFADAQKVGTYILRTGEAKHYLAVNLLDAAESDINPSDQLASFAPGVKPAAPQHAGVVETPLWLYVLLGAVVVLLGEGYVWCKDF
ncbi:MAG: VWA domain-containing protein [Candidatus Tectomicrobia bacterium]|uniref:VWA domain-containing protein n=1 Tax=Tectimicrobiota bacterium TaxID=2528274 RepID=A0A938B2A7_UNCTE|nr:VWA domain-containing protein [Candidatus Tectomicrobia bacterium]